MSAINNQMSQAADLLISTATTQGWIADCVGSSGASWYVKLTKQIDDDLYSYTVRISDHNVGLLRDKPDFNVQLDEQRGLWNGYADVIDAIEEVIDEAQSAIENN